MIESKNSRDPDIVRDVEPEIGRESGAGHRCDETARRPDRAGQLACRSGQLAIDDPGYPSRLRALPDAPERLWVRGEVAEAGSVVAIVGARAARHDDVQRAREIARDVAADGTLIVSGGALGVDAAGHRGALDASGTTVAVLGCGLDVIYPEQHRDLFDSIVRAGGSVVSQFEPTAPPLPWHFVHRNRTIAAMADAVLVIAASRRSGSLHTARAARALGRLVAAVPGTAGCEALIASGAAPVRDAEELVRALDGRLVVEPVVLPDAESPAGRVLRALYPDRGRDADEIAVVTDLDVREVNRALTCLELDGLAILLPGRNYLCSTLAYAQLAR